MNKNLSAIALMATLGTIGSISSATAGESARKNYVGPAISSFYGVTGIGANARFSISENLSARPFAIFSSGNNGASATTIGSSVTYDYNFPKSDWTIYGGLGAAFGSGSNGSQASGLFFAAGIEYRISDSLVLNSNGLSDRSGSAGTFGVGFNF
jgi:hypothetical protein